MKIKWRGHASFLIELGSKKIITDPFNESYGYPMNPVAADFVTVSHEHRDHNAVETVDGQPRIIRGSGMITMEGIIIKGIASFHDKHQGRERGQNTIFKISTEDINLVHLGDLGHVLSAGQVQEIGAVDILLLPIGGRYTIEAGEASQIVSLLQPRVVIPMHFGTPHLSFKLAPLEEFTARYDLIIKKPSLELQACDLGQEMKIIVLDYL
ncbi:MAG: MBL fold metallo-hydrolase [Firmicutes bacterium HGW-Firmicutes-15]|nr:MAG: MBL fold metallo-hydrolase [Firmicutes bacterium HGW-Firmicutes-15]